MANYLAFLSSYLLSQYIRPSTLLTAAVIALSGCASMTEQECLTANWFDQGFRDGRSGQPLSRIADHQKACAKVGVKPDNALYFQGRDQGIQIYCTPENALAVGRLGQPYRNVCPAALEQQFLMSYEKGKQHYEAELRIEALNRDTRQLELLLRAEDNKEKRRYLRQNIRDLDWERQRAREEQYYLERRLGD